MKIPQLTFCRLFCRLVLFTFVIFSQIMPAAAQPLAKASEAAKTPAPVAGAWGYDEKNGPANWCGLGSSYSACCNGAMQTPVNITKEALEFVMLPKLNFEYVTDAELEVHHHGHTVEVKVITGAALLTLGKKSFRLMQFHFHTQSEHTVLGHALPMEMHLVHQADDGALVFAGVLIAKGQKHEELDKVWQSLPQQSGESIAVMHFDLSKLLPGRRETFRYNGSLETPPCTEGMTWNLFAQPLQLSEEQIQAFTTLFSGADFPKGNRRPVQPLKGRKIMTDLDKTALSKTLLLE